MIKFLLLFMVTSCSPHYYQEDQNFERLAENARVDDFLFLGSVREGDVIKLAITGEEIKNDLSEVYAKSVKSSWKVEQCNSNNPHGLERCRWKKRSGRCRILYRDYLGEITQEIDFSDRDAWPFQVTIGGVPYPLEENFSVRGGTLYARLATSKAMLVGGDDLKLEIIRKDPEDERVGFMGLENCEGQGEKSFSVNDPLDFEEIPGDRFRVLEVSATRRLK